MKCPSLFHFYRAYYGGVSQGKVNFAKAISETGKQLEIIFQTRDSQGHTRYANREYAYALTKGFLQKFFELAEYHYGEQFFDELEWLKNRIVMPKDLVGNREVYIPFSYCFAPKEKRLIFIEYGKVEEAERWLPIFKTLVESFVINDSLPDIQMVTYWDLMKGTTMELSYPDSFLAPKERVIQTARLLVEQAVRKR
ncbi:hypothetical protein KP806_24100 [Paenibacillus sp. N4]|uniref:hypothetical protein n=1 Tax=Paenibacillus vietnamensis TaxID=2590547 RepID=UPI001CD0863A|nr:hypothetical protein [Paenibacillus vietnamensis]MCA0758144.1 hypothetical protein [Paenibacillus vietnamensis]